MYDYGHGGNAPFEGGNEHVIDLSANINPLGLPDGVASAILRAIPDCDRYPDSFSTALREKISEFEGVEPSRLFCGNGASDIIFRLPRAARAHKVLVAAPTFSDYERAAISSGAEVIRYTLSPANGFALDGGFIEMAEREKPDLMYVCNPNNPTGKLTENSFIRELLDCCRETGALVAIDECFLDFAAQAHDYTSKLFLDACDRIVIFKAFTKLFALPGIRLGYAMCADEELIAGLHFHGPDWPVSNLAQAAGLAALEGTDYYVKQAVEFVQGERAAMEHKLADLSYKVFPSGANYVFLQSPYPFDLREELDRRGIRIRSCGNYYGLDGSYFRIAVSTRENNAKLLAAVAEITR